MVLKRDSLFGAVPLGFCIFAANWAVVREITAESPSSRPSPPPFTSLCVWRTSPGCAGFNETILRNRENPGLLGPIHRGISL